MRASVDIENSLHYALDGALLLYADRAGAHHGRYITRHAVELDERGVPRLGPASLLSSSFLKKLLHDLDGERMFEFLPANVLAITGSSLCWWTPASVRTMFYQVEGRPELAALSGAEFPQPPLLFHAFRGGLRVRALGCDRRPDATTPLYRAPYWNVYDGGSVCLGSTPLPGDVAARSAPDWERSFFSSAFTHPNSSARLTAHPKGFVGLWNELKGQTAFPPDYLAETGETVGHFLILGEGGKARP